LTLLGSGGLPLGGGPNSKIHMWCLRLLLLAVLLPWSSSVKRGRTPAGTPLISTSFPQLSSADVGTRRPISDMAERLLAPPFFIRNRWQLKKVGPHLKEKLCF
jgi:hypothetical protein